MTDTALLELLRSWIDTVLNTNYGLNRPVIFGEQNAPAPAKPYIVIHRPLATTKQGRESTLLNPTNYDIQRVINNYEAVVSITSVGNQTDDIRYILDSIGTQETKDYFYDNDISFMRQETIQSVPDLSAGEWELNTVVDIVIMYPHTTTEDTGYIDTVETENNI